MKVLIFACLVAFTFAKQKEQISVSRETIESISSSEESITHINKKPERFENYNQQQKEDERQDKTHPFVQPQPLFYPYAEPMPYPVLPQNILPLAQPAMVLSLLQPEVMEVPNAIIPQRNVMQLPKSPVVPFLQRQIPNQIPNLTDLKAQLPLPLLQPWMPQIPQPLLQTPMLPTQPLVSLPQSKVLPLSQQVLTYPQRAMTMQEPLFDLKGEFYRVAQPIAPAYNLQQV
ncbi:PREDICTED: LOW QUALITY PROTEIN: beta-casein-like [Myotis davidii]|uniref:LOW QUALITY PROTEIN: beta-casein-like n=1 Tax=Myotis davidii TaxID=225400 RepID=UPI0007671898|nr:PREDICTED: LOW QUALITY PROTEIN: beta-casein-like [Myotis davidii]